MIAWQEGQFNTFDGLVLFYRYREPSVASNKACILLHRGHEHSGRVISFAERLKVDHVWHFAFDLRGHGKSSGVRAWAPSFDTWVKDLNCFFEYIQQAYDISSDESILIANSVGAVMATRWIINYNPKVKGCILAAPAFSIRLYIPFALQALRLAKKMSATLFVTSYVRSGFLTRNKVEATAYDKDKLITKKIGVNVLVSLFDAAKNCLLRAKDFETPVLMFTAGKDVVVNNKFHYEFFEKISSDNKKHIVLHDFKHAIFHERDQHKVVGPCREFIADLFKSEKINLPAIIPKAREHTVKEFEELVSQASVFKQIFYVFLRFLLMRIFSCSDGVRLGLKCGFDSGVSLDYVYLNKAQGRTVFGRFVDHVYLNAVGWRGIRTRKIHIKKTLAWVTHVLHERGVRPVVLDIASGPGRYLLEFKRESAFPVSLHLSDIDKKSIEKAKAIASDFDDLGTKFYIKNAFEGFNANDYSERPNVVIISGLFELYHNNKQVYTVIQSIASLVADGGFVIYTGQPWHPQIEMIARLLNNRKGERWIMRRRIQKEMDQLVEAAGFNKLNTIADDLGIFTVSCARK